MELELRPATDADRGFCFALHEAAMGGYVTAVWGWDDAVQRRYFDRGWDPSITRIVTRHGQGIGILKLEERADAVYLALIEIHPDFQGRGIGGMLLREIIADADRCRRPVELDVLHVNTRAQELYRRLGFTERYRHGDHDIKVRMRRDPSAFQDEFRR
jgi:ribosomal protein S18 acetylase RimI-like enzyme